MTTLWQQDVFATRFARSRRHRLSRPSRSSTLALGIGANTAIFSVVNTSLLRPLPFHDSAQLVDLWGHSSMFDFPNLGMSLPDIEDIRAQNSVFSSVAPYKYSSMTLTRSGAPQQLDAAENFC